MRAEVAGDLENHLVRKAEAEARQAEAEAEKKEAEACREWAEAEVVGIKVLRQAVFLVLGVFVFAVVAVELLSGEAGVGDSLLRLLLR